MSTPNEYRSFLSYLPLYDIGTLRVAECHWCYQQGVSLTGRYTTGPPSRAAVACCPLVSYVAYASVTYAERQQTTTTDDNKRRQTPMTVTTY